MVISPGKVKRGHPRTPESDAPTKAQGGPAKSDTSTDSPLAGLGTRLGAAGGSFLQFYVSTELMRRARDIERENDLMREREIREERERCREREERRERERSEERHRQVMMRERMARQRAREDAERDMQLMMMFAKRKE